jgi:cytochrome c2
MTAIKQDGPYDSRTLTKVFCVSSILLAVTIVWMVLDDHTRSWRDYQERFREVELKQAEATLDEARRTAAPAEAKLEKERADALAIVEQRQAEIKAAQKSLDEAQAKKEAADLAYSVAKSYVDSFTYYVEETGAEKEATEHASYDLRLAAANTRLDECQKDKEAAQLGVDAAKARVEGLREPLIAEQKHADEVDAKVNQAARKVKQIGPSFINDWFRNRPGVDFFDPTEKVKQVVLDNLKDDYYFAQVRKVDRCQTCHLAIDRKGFEGTIVHVEGKGLVTVSQVKPAGGGYDITLLNGHVDHVATDAVHEQLPIKAPFTSHPDLDLFMSSSSPHPADKFGCTVCHMGEGQSVSFTTASHSPNNEVQREEWATSSELKWADREFWNWPQFPTRYVQASCLLCHANNRPVPGADKLNFGRETWERLSCTGCHKMKGFEDEAKRGPDLRKAVKKLKIDWVAYWIEDPARFRPKTNMPRFFNGPECALIAPTAEEKKEATKAAGPEDKAKVLYDYDVREQVEIKAITRFIFDRSASYMADAKARGEDFELPAFENGNPARGKVLFTARGCVGCHRIESTQSEAASLRTYAPDEFGPNLYNLGYKTTPEWVMAWVSNPKHYWAETRMPNLRIEKEDARDIATYLINGDGVKDAELPNMKKAGWVAEPVDALPGGKSQLEYAVKDYLEKDYTGVDIAKILAGTADKALPNLGTDDQRLMYLGEQTVGRLGCFGCHYVKGMESRPGIGRELTDIGDKNLTQVDWGFESVSRFAEHKPADKIRENRHEWLGLKVKNPRIFDRGKVKLPLDRSRMPQFKTTAFEREALVTYLLGHTSNRRVPDEYKYKPSVRRANVIEGEYAMLRNNCKACHLLGVDEISVTDDKGVVRQPRLDAKGEPMKSAVSGEPLMSRAWLQGHVVLDNVKLYGDDNGAALIQLYASAPAVGKNVGEFLAVFKGSQFKTIDELRPQLVGADADLVKVLNAMPADVWGADEKEREANKSAQLAAIKKGLPWRNRGGTSLDKIIEGRTTEKVAQGKDPAKFDFWSASGKENFDTDSLPVAQIADAKTFGPPHLLNEGLKIQPLWLQSFLKDPTEIRPALRAADTWKNRDDATFASAGGAHMPTYGFTDAGTQVFSRYFASTDEETRLALARPVLEEIQNHVKAKDEGYRTRLDIQNKVYPALDQFQVREYFNIVIVDSVFNFTPRGDVSLSRALDEKTDAYFAEQEKAHPGWYSGAYRLYVDPAINCQKCHIVRGQTPAGTVDAWAPDLWRVRERLRPPYLQQWIANPAAIIPGTKMAQLFMDGNNTNILPGKADVRIAAVVDWLMAGVPGVLEAFPKNPKAGDEVRLTSELLNLDNATVEVQENGSWTKLEEGKGFTREKSASRVTALGIPTSSTSDGKVFQIRVRDDRYTAIADVNVGGK